MSSGAFKNNANNDESFVAEVAMATQYTAVKLGGDANSVDLADANSDQGIGITQEAQAIVDAPITVRTAGYSMARSDGGWTKGDKLTGSTGGTLATTTTAGHMVCAIAQETVATTELGEVQIISPAQLYSTFA
jgi:hypothetical protein